MRFDKGSALCGLSGERGSTGPPGKKPEIPRYMIIEMKGIKGDHGKSGTHGFTGPRGKTMKPTTGTIQYFSVHGVPLDFGKAQGFVPGMNVLSLTAHSCQCLKRI